MEANFWHQKWQRGDIGFHLDQANPLLVAHLDQLKLKANDRLFMPLCGKSLDIGYLLQRGYRVAGAELSEIAIQALFQSLQLQPTISDHGRLKHYQAGALEIFVGDIFELTAQQLGPIDAIYDRAALVALPAEIRRCYAAHLVDITQAAPQLVIAYEYDQSLIDGPPFSVDANEIRQLYAETYAPTALETRTVEGGMKGKVAAIEKVWRLDKLGG